MGCCTIKKDTSSTKELEKLKGYFDEVTLEDKGAYNLLTLKDRANKANYDYIVWLSVKVQKGYTYEQTHSSKTDDEMIEKVCSSILDWIDILKNFEKKNTEHKQLSLFEEFNDDSEELEKMPINDGNWDKYFRECEKVRKRNLMKQYGFFDLLNISFYTYNGIDYRKKLPTTEEVRELFKKAITIGKENPGRHEWFWFDSPDYLSDNDGLSDYELKNRLRSIRIYLLPYKSYFSVGTDLSYTATLFEETTHYRYYLDGNRLSTYDSCHDNDKLKLPTYDNLFDEEFLLWLRDFMSIKKAEVISDEDILKENIKSFMNSLLWYERRNYDFVKRINTVSNWKEFKKDLFDFCKEKGIDKQNGGCSGCSLDDFGGWIELSKKGKIEVTQDCKTREALKRNIDGLKVDNYGHYIVWNLTGDEIYQKTYELFDTKHSTLFDFAA